MVKKTKKKSEKIDYEKEKRKDKNTIIAVASIAAVVAILVVVSFVLNQTHNGSDKASMIDNVRCESVLPQGFQADAHIDVILDGKTMQVPSEIGIVNNTCKYWMYTQDTTGIIHIISSENMQFTLAQFFDIWKATSDLPPPGTPVVYLNGQSTSSNMNDVKISPHDEIAIIYGNKPAIIPSSYQFPPSS